MPEHLENEGQIVQPNLNNKCTTFTNKLYVPIRGTSINSCLL